MNKAVLYSNPLTDSLIEQLRWIQEYTKEVIEACEAGGSGSRASFH